MNPFKNKYLGIISLYLLWRSGLLAIAFLAPKFILEFGNKFPYVEILKSSNLPYWIWSLGNFDGVHYLRIAQDGYAYQYTQAFFPLYPMLIKLTSTIFSINHLLAALLISNISFLAGLLLFFKVMKSRFNENTALWSCIFLLAFPTSFYFGAVYTEGLFFLLMMIFFYSLDKENFFISTAVSGFASATRLIGIFFAPLFLFNIDPKTIFSHKKNLISAILSTSGLVSYIIYLKLKFNEPFYFLTSQTAFGQERSATEVVLLPQVFYRYIKIFFSATGSALITASFEFLATIFALAILILSYRKIKKEWFWFSIFSIVIPSLTGTLASMPRYILIAFPIFVYLATIKNTYFKIAVLILSIVALTVTTAFFTRGYWVA